MLRASVRQFGNSRCLGDEISGGLGGQGAAVRRVFPVPEIAPPGVVHGPGRQQFITQVAQAGVAGFEDAPVLTGVAQTDQFVEEGQDHDDTTGLLVVLPGSGLGVGVARPGIGGGVEVAPFREQVAPVPGGGEPALVAGDLISAQQALAHVGAEVELDHAVGVALLEHLAFDGDTDGEKRPGMLRRRLATIEQEVPHVGQVRDGRRVAGVAVVVRHAKQDADGPLADVGGVPVAGGNRGDRAVGGNRPLPAEHVSRVGGHGGVGGGPGIALQASRRRCGPGNRTGRSTLDTTAR